MKLNIPKPDGICLTSTRALRSCQASNFFPISLTLSNSSAACMAFIRPNNDEAVPLSHAQPACIHTASFSFVPRSITISWTPSNTPSATEAWRLDASSRRVLQFFGSSSVYTISRLIPDAQSRARNITTRRSTFYALDTTSSVAAEGGWQLQPRWPLFSSRYGTCPS